MPTARALALSLALLLDGAAAQWSATGGLGVTVGTGIFDVEAALAAGEWQGGEWTCVMKLAGEPDAASLEDAQLLGYHSPLWTAEGVLNPDSDPLTPGENAKYESYNSQRFSYVTICVGALDNCLQPISFAEKPPNAAALFDGPYREFAFTPETETVFGVSGNPVHPTTGTPCRQWPGFNIRCRDGNRARFGYCNDISTGNNVACSEEYNLGSAGEWPDDVADSDGVLGVGISGEDCCAGNAGWTNHFVDQTPNAEQNKLKQAWIFVLTAATLVPDGWAVVLKTNGDTTFSYSSPYWWDDQTLHPDSNPTEPGNAKYRYYLDLPFDAVMGCVGSLKNCLTYELPAPVAKAADLFDGPYRAEGVNEKEFLAVFNETRQRDCRPQRPGFHTRCGANTNAARWGFCNNAPSEPCQAGDDNDADGVIGFGIGTNDQSRWDAGCGHTSSFVSDSFGLERSLQAWILVRAVPDPANVPIVPNGWVVAMKSDGDDTWKYSSALWEDASTLNTGEDPTEVGNAKYDDYNTKPLDAVMLCIAGVGHQDAGGGHCTSLGCAKCLPPQVFDAPIPNARLLFNGPYRGSESDNPLVHARASGRVGRGRSYGGYISEDWIEEFGRDVPGQENRIDGAGTERAANNFDCPMQRPVRSDAFSMCCAGRLANPKSITIAGV